MRTTVRQNKAECTGCGACVSICPKNAIVMEPDAEGFLYPAVHPELCVGCDLCEKRCPAGHEGEKRRPYTLGMRHKDPNVRAASSSGGVFTALARETIQAGGVVFGAVFDESLHVEHVGAFDEGESQAMRGSKYVQSDCAEAINHASSLLSRGIPVLFSGTPCQIDGLLAKVGKKEREQLLTLDFVCHGVPSPGVFASYIAMLEREKGQRVLRYTFRDKRFGWKNFAAVATFEDGSEHVGTQTDEPFLRGFLQNLYLRPSCAACEKLRGAGHAADITLADLWGAQEVCPGADDDKGLSLVMVNTQKGRRALEACAPQLAQFPVGTQKLLRYNPSIEKPAPAHAKRRAFFERFERHGFTRQDIDALLRGPGRAERLIKRALHAPQGALRRLRAALKR